jgi:hypothetical protein
MAWKETTPVPPVQPERKGFGHTVIIDMVSAALSAQVSVDYPPSGFVWHMKTSG